ncbi:hypothetical protein KUA50_001790 [Segatella hominis]|jgi:hypothetical protein|uniref:hypothetical protein n=1 Tax=Segatella hominis TaxID=2518605 RepID=UPI001C458FA9|nr:hypothetical protein [Segatella hominis]WOZ81724.1 hypothetical protein KUA50_001790 [Segatella hominis]
MKYLYILLIGSILLFEACGSKTHTYYNDKNGFTFSVVEQENNDVLILGKTDSIFLPWSLHGQYLPITFYMHDNSNIIYLRQDFEMLRCTLNKYKIRYLKKEIRTQFYPIYPELGNNYWVYDGGCDQSRYCFNVFRDTIFVKGLEPLEWE